MPNEHVSLEVAQRLQKAGWKGDTDRYWVNNGTNQWELLSSISIPLYIPEKDTNLVIPAPSAVQLAEELPAKYVYGRHFDSNIYWCRDKEHMNEWLLEGMTEGDTLADSVGNMRAHLLENGLIAK